MNHWKSSLTALLAAVAIGCATHADALNKISLGMTKADVIKELGAPDTTSAIEGKEYLTYVMRMASTQQQNSRKSQYFVRIVDGKVDAFGRKGDFGTTTLPKQVVDFNLKEDTTVHQKP